VDRLTSHFKAILISSRVDVDLITDQWTIIKPCLYKEPQKITWTEVNRMLRETCPDFLDLVDLVLCMPASTADCERGFNVMKMVKSDWRSSLKDETLSDLLFVYLSSPSIKDFDPSPICPPPQSKTLTLAQQLSCGMPAAYGQGDQS